MNIKLVFNVNSSEKAHILSFNGVFFFFLSYIILFDALSIRSYLRSCKDTKTPNLKVYLKFCLAVPFHCD